MNPSAGAGFAVLPHLPQHFLYLREKNGEERARSAVCVCVCVGRTFSQNS